MQGLDDYNTVLSYSMQALALMLKNKTPPTPENYAKWYKHAAELYREGKCDCDSTPAIKTSLTKAVKKSSKAPEKPAEEFGDVEEFQVSRVKDLVKKTATKTRAFNGAMGDISKELEKLKSNRVKTGAKKPPHPEKKSSPPHHEGKFIPFQG